MANGEVTTGKVIALIRALSSTSSTSSATYTVTDALILGAATTSGVRLDLESGALAVREGDDSDYGQIRAQGAYRSGGAFQIGSDNSTRAQISDLSGANVYWNFTSTVFQGGSSTVHNWTASTATAAADTGLARDSAAQVVVTDGSTGVGNLRATALVVGTADTNGVRLDLESGVLACREGDDSAYAPLRVFSLGVGTGTSASSGDINCSQITASSWFNGNGTGAFIGPLLYQGSYTSSQSVAHASSGRVIHNASASGDIEITLPAMAGKGSFFVVFVGSANYLKITANAADKIRNGATASVSGGYIRSNTVGSAMLLVGTGTSDWSVIGPTGTWTIDS